MSLSKSAKIHKYRIYFRILIQIILDTTVPHFITLHSVVQVTYHRLHSPLSTLTSHSACQIARYNAALFGTYSPSVSRLYSRTPPEKRTFFSTLNNELSHLFYNMTTQMTSPYVIPLPDNSVVAIHRSQFSVSWVRQVGNDKRYNDINC